MPGVLINDERASLLVAGVVLATAAGLAWREYRDRSRREPSPDPQENRYYRFRDLRRGIGVVVMLVVAAGIVYGSRIPPGLHSGPNPAFIVTWLAITLLILGLVILALIDWLALRLHAVRVRRALSRERVEIISDEIRRRRAAGGNGRASDSLDDLI